MWSLQALHCVLCDEQSWYAAFGVTLTLQLRDVMQRVFLIFVKDSSEFYAAENYGVNIDESTSHIFVHFGSCLFNSIPRGH
jgi:hypothetical protein